ncbi:MAG: antibiotic biosynthesis monooxygenase [Zoogloeaceae bacterium]|jgi:heme-degrading monooxygenase HmoA|nr:antibiotic biosynthesis monooxygenase [Zoogloeaceae bacterium]
MFLAMNRFKIALGREEEFIDHWRRRESHLDSVPGFVRFHLLKGETNAEYTLFASHTEWVSEQAFADWTRSEAFMKAHANAGRSARELYLGGPQLELFEAIL